MTASIGQLPVASSVVGADQIEVEVAATVASKRISVTDLIAAVAPLIDHGGLAGLADDDHTQYYNQARGDARYATLAIANLFTALQTITTPSSTGVGLTVNTQGSGQQAVIANSGDFGTAAGPMISIGRNNNASTPAPGALVLGKVNTDGNAYVWCDDSGNLRTILNAQITSANRNSGTVVGTQTSSLDSKDVLEGVTGIDDVLAAVQRGAEAVRRFTYKSGAYGGEQFEGVVVDFQPRYGMDRDAEHPAGKSLNVIEVIGDLLRAVDHLSQRVVALEAIH